MVEEGLLSKLRGFPLSKIQADVPLPGDLYLFINGHYVKYKEAGDILPGSKMNLFLSKNVKDVFFVDESFKEVREELDALFDENFESIVQKVGEENRELVQKQMDVRDALFDVFTDQELTTANVDMLQKMGKNFIEELSKKSNLSEIVGQLFECSEVIADHSMNVGSIAVYLAMVLGKGDKSYLEEIYMASLLHDYGKIRIPAHLLENSKSMGYSKAVKDHPTKGVEQIKKIKGISESVLKVVLHHHEQHNGKGYPKQLHSSEIHPMAKIFSIANIYDNVLKENLSKGEAEAHKIAIKFIEYDRGKMFDPQLTPRVVEGLKLAFGNYAR